MQQIRSQSSKTRTPDVPTSRAAEPACLDAIAARIAAGDVLGGMDELVRELGRLRWSLCPSDWLRFVRDDARKSDLFRTTYLDPLTRRARDRPRGYPGDAVMLDMLYGVHEWGAKPDGVGGRILRYTSTLSEASQAVRWRRAALAHHIDEAASRFESPSVLSMACGHLRELELSAAARRGELGSVVGLDVDPDSLDFAAVLHQQQPLTTRRCSVRRVLSGALELPPCHLAYAAGILDYLEAPVARLLIKRMAAAVTPGGALLVANFLEGARDAGYMSAMMDWQLIYRAPEAFESLLQDLERDRVRDIRFFSDPLEYVRYAVVRMDD